VARADLLSPPRPASTWHAAALHAVLAREISTFQGVSPRLAVPLLSSSPGWRGEPQGDIAKRVCQGPHISFFTPLLAGLISKVGRRTFCAPGSLGVRKDKRGARKDIPLPYGAGDKSEVLFHLLLPFHPSRGEAPQGDR